MVIDITDTLLESVKEELLNALRAAEVRVVDMFEFGESHGSEEILENLHSVKATLLMIGEKSAASLCESIRLAIVDSIDHDDVDDHDGLADSFLTLTQYVERLSVSSHAKGEVKDSERLMLANAQLVLEGSDANALKTHYPLSEKQKKIVASAAKALVKIENQDANSFWQGIYKTSKVVKSEVNTQESHELIWLIEQVAILNVKGTASTSDADRKLIFSVYRDYLNDILSEGETIVVYQTNLVSDCLGVLKEFANTHDVLHNDYRPPNQRLQSEKKDEPSLVVVFSVSSETIETIAFLVKKELSTTKQLFEQALLVDDFLKEETKVAILDSLKSSKATFKILNFNAGQTLIEEAEKLINIDGKIDDWKEKFAENLILVDDALWQLDYLEQAGILNPQDAASQQKAHTKNMAAEAAKVIVSEGAYDFFKSSRENVIENFSLPEKINLVQNVKEVHLIRSSVILLGVEGLAEQLSKAEQLHLFLINQTKLLEDGQNLNIYMNVLVGYEIIFEQLKTSLSVDRRALKILTESQSQLSAAIHFNPEQMAKVDHDYSATSGLSSRQTAFSDNSEILSDTPENVTSDNFISDGVMDSEKDNAKEDYSVEPSIEISTKPDETERDEQVNILADSASGVSTVMTALANRSTPDNSVISLPASDIDEEILEIFLDEGCGIAEQLKNDIPSLEGNYFNENIIGDIRRAFHTLKGSGRMVGLNVFGEFAWQHEELLNKVSGGEIALNDVTQELFNSSLLLIESTVRTKPFVEEREALLLAAAQAKTVREMLQSGESFSPLIHPNKDDALPASDSENTGINNLTTADAVKGQESRLNDADLEILAAKLSEKESYNPVHSSDALKNVSTHPALSSNKVDNNNPHNDQLQKIAQTADLIGGLGDVLHEDFAAVFSALSQVNRSGLDGSRIRLFRQLDKIAELSRENLGNKLEKSQVQVISDAIKSLKESSTEVEIKYSDKALEQLASAWFASKSDGLTNVASFEEDISWALDYIEANEKLFDGWEKDKFSKESTFNGLRQNMMGFERLLLNNRIHNPIALTVKVLVLFDAIAADDNAVEDFVADSVKQGIIEIRRVIEELQCGEDNVVASVNVINQIESSISALHAKPSSQSKLFDNVFSEIDASSTFPNADNLTVPPPVTAMNTMAGDQLTDAAQAFSNQLPPQKIVASGYLGSEGDLGENIDALKAQIMPSNQTFEEFQHSEIVNSLYDVEASLDEQDVPPWTWEAMSNLESAVTGMKDKSLSPSPADFERITQALETIKNSSDIDTATAKKINNSLMGLRAELTGREGVAGIAKNFADLAKNELSATGQSFDNWKGTGFNPDDGLSNLIDNFEEVGAQSRAANYNEADELSSLVNNLLARLRNDNVVPYENISDIVGEAVEEITKVNSQFHGDSLVSPALKTSLEQQRLVTQVGVEYVPIADIDNSQGKSTVQSSEDSSVVTTGVNAISQPVPDSLRSVDEVAENGSYSSKNAADNNKYNALEEGVANKKSDNAHISDQSIENSDLIMTDMQKEHFVAQSEQHIKASRKEFDLWEESGFTNGENLGQLTENFDCITQISEANNFESGKKLGNLVGEVLGRIDDEIIIPNEQTSQSVSEAIDEFGRTSEAISTNDESLGKQNVTPSLLEKLRSISNLSSLGNQSATEVLQTSTFAFDETNEIPVESSATLATEESFDSKSPIERASKTDKQSELVNSYHDYAKSATPSIESFKENFDKWKAKDFELNESLDGLSSDVKNITDSSEKHGFDSGAELGKSVSSILSEVVNQNVVPEKETTDHVETAVDEFSRSAKAIESGGKDQEINPSVIEKVRYIVEKIASNKASTKLAEDLARDASTLEVQAEACTNTSEAMESLANDSVDIEVDNSHVDNSGELVDAMSRVESYLADYAKEAMPEIESSQKNYNEWKGTEFELNENLDNLTSNVKSISDASKKHGVEDASELADSVNEVLSQVTGSGAKAPQHTAEGIESAISEFSRSTKAIQDNSGAHEVRHEVISNVQGLVSASKDINLESEQSNVQVDSIPSVQNYLSDFARDAMPAIENSESNYNDWKSTEYELNDKFDKLTNNVKDISVSSEKHGVEDVNELAESVGDILSQVMNSGDTPQQATTDGIECAINEFSRSAKAIQDESGVHKVRQEVVSSIKELASSSELNNFDLEPSANLAGTMPSVQNYLTEYVQDALPAIENSKSNYNDWKSNEFELNDKFEKLTNNVKDISVSSEKHGVEDVKELAESVGDILSQVMNSGVRPPQDTADGIESAINEFSRSAQSIQDNNSVNEVRREVISNIQGIISSNGAANASNLDGKRANELADTVQSSAYLTEYAHEAMSAIESSKSSFDDWKNTEFELNQQLDRLTEDVKDISTSSEKYGVDDASELAHSVRDILTQVMDSGDKAPQDTADGIESAINEFSRSAKAIQNINGIQEVRQEVITNIQGLINTDTSMNAAANEANTPAKFNLTSQQVSDGAESATEITASAQPQLTNESKSDFEQTVNQPIEDPVAPFPKLEVSKTPSTSDFEGLKFNDPSTLDETIIEIFLDEAKNLTLQNDQSLSDWKLNYDDLSALQEIQRGLHTLKGGARMAELTVLGDLSHNVETLVDAVVDGQISDKDGAHKVLQSGLSLSGNMVMLADNQRVIVESPEYYELLNGFLRKQTGKTLDLPAPERGDTGEGVIDDVVDEDVLSNDNSQQGSNETLSVAEDVPTIDTDLSNKAVPPVQQVLIQSKKDTAVPHAPEESTPSSINNCEGLKFNDPSKLDETILEIFLDEAKDLVANNDSSLDAWKSNYDDLSSLQEIQRGMHTLKGGARMAELTVLGDLSHNVETLVDAVVDGQVSDKNGAHKVLQSGLSLSGEMVTLANTQNLIVESPEYYELLNDFLRDQTGKTLELPSPKHELAKTDSIDDIAIQEDEKINDPSLADSKVTPSVAVIQTDDTSQQNSNALPNSLDKQAFDNTQLDSNLTLSVSQEAPSLAAQLANQPVFDFEQVVNQSTEKSDVPPTAERSLPSANNDFEGLKFNDPKTLDETILEIFLDEAKDLVVQNDLSLSEWKTDNDDLSALQKIQRGLHTLKGGARMAELTVLGDLSHNIEALLDAIVDGQVIDKNGAHIVLQSGLSLSSEMVMLADNQKVIVESPDYYDMLSAFLREQTGKKLQLPAPKRIITDKKLIEDDGEDDSSLLSQHSAPVENRRKSQQRKSYMMRVSSDLIEKLTGLVGEDVISRSRIERYLLEHSFQIDELSRTVGRVSEQLRRLENETEAQILFRNDSVVDTVVDEDFDPLELDRFSEIQQLSRSLAESMHDLDSIRGSLTDYVDGTRQILLDQNNIQRELQDGVLSASLIRFDSVAPRFERMVEQVAAELGKEVAVQIYGGHNDIERNMLEDLIPGFEHTIRNCLAHGIETPDEREKAGKPRQGRIRVAVRREGAEIGFMIADDGRGANLAAIRDKARRLNLLDESKASDKNYLLQLLFEPGFSTQEQATQISGRGIGMDVMRDAINRHQGSIDVESEPEKGMATFIRLPFAMSITEALSVHIGRYQYAIPVMSVEGIARIPNEEYEPFANGLTTFYSYGQNRYKIESLIQFFDPRAERISHPQGVPALLVRIGSKRLALEVEEIGSRQEIIIKSVNPQFTSLPGIIGATVLDNGMPVPVMEATTLGRHFLSYLESSSEERETLQPDVIEETNIQPKILVVDDSITMRKVTSKILTRYDVEHKTAKDGLDAIDVISEWVPDVILLDIEMPRMDGFEFATHIRNDSTIAEVPIIMITSRTGSKHRERADLIGVNDYLGKPYTEEILIASLQKALNIKLQR